MPRPAPAERPAVAAPGRRSGLRGLPAGYDLDRLPLAVPSVIGELAAGWLSRVAHRYGLTPHALLTAIGAPTPSYNLRTVAEHLHRHAGQVTALLGSPPPGRSSADVEAWDGVLAGYQHAYAGGVGRWPSGSRFCPACLAGSADPSYEADGADAVGAGRAVGVAGVWSAGWLSPLQVVCLIHRVLLVSCCPGCGQVPWSSSAWTSRSRPGWSCPEHLPVPRWRPGQPRAAAKGARRAWCGYDLRLVGAQQASDLDVEVQQYLRDAAEQAMVDPDGPRAVCGAPATCLEHLHALLELVVEHRGSVAGLWRLGSDPRLLLDGLAAAVAVLTEPGPGGAVTVADRHGLLAGGRCTPIGPDSTLRRRPHNGLLGAVRLGTANAAGALSPAAQLTFRVGSGRPRYPASGVLWADHPGSARGGQLPLRAVPQLLWPGLLHDHLADAAVALTPAPGQDPAGAMVVARACAAMFLARLGSTRPWRLIAIELGLPAWLADQPAALRRRLVERGRWPVFLADLDQLADHLEAELPPVDYRTRRQLCDDPQRLLAAVRAGRLLADDLAPGAASDELLARMFWQIYTGGDLRLAAPPVGCADPATTAVRQQRLEQLRSASTRTLLATQAVLETYGRVEATGPLVWSPSGTGSPVCGDSIPSVVWSRLVEQDQDWSGGDDDIALSAALGAAEEDLTGHAFQPWLWRWLDVNYGICDTDDNAYRVPAVWALRSALTDPDTEPTAVRHPALAAALRHTTRTSDGGVQRWQMLRHPPS